MFEVAFGLMLVGCLIFNIVSKYHDETMIFMLNPCHVTAVSISDDNISFNFFS